MTEQEQTEVGNERSDQLESDKSPKEKHSTKHSLSFAWVKSILGKSRKFAWEIGVALVLAIFAAIWTDRWKENRGQRILEQNKKAIATILSIGKADKMYSLGSGFFISDNGILVTNYHVIANVIESKGVILARLPTGAVYFLKGLLGANKGYDVAILQFDALDTPHIQFGDSKNVWVGERVFAIGSPMGLEQTVSDGIISSPLRLLDGKEFIQFTAAISHGSSGGGLFTEMGKVIGITSMFIGSDSKAGKQEGLPQNLNFAIPAHVIAKALESTNGPLADDSADYHYSIGVLSENKNEYEDAAENFKKAIALNNNYGQAYVELGNVYYEQGRFDDQITTMVRATELVKNDKDVYANLAYAYENKGLFEKAMVAYEQALHLAPNDKDTLFNFGLLCIVTNQTKKLKDVESMLVKLNPGQARELKLLAK